MKTHYGLNNMAACKAPVVLQKTCTYDIEAVDCLGCLWMAWGSLLGQADVCANRIKVVSTEAINRAEYRIGEEKLV